jgi:ketosteroid isomerase-like protein
MTDNVAEQIVRLEQELASAMVEGDVAALDRLYADKFVFAHASGFIDSKGSWLDRFATDLKYEFFATTELTVRVFGDTAVSMGKTQTTTVTKSTARKHDLSLRFMRVYMRNRGEWRIVAHSSGASVVL